MTTPDGDAAARAATTPRATPPRGDVPALPRRPHLLGIGGVGMAALAELLQADGAKVSGTDAKDSATLQRLRGLGIDASAPHLSSPPDDADCVIYSSAIRENNPELAAARERGLPVLHRSQAIALLAAPRRLIAVAGAHGKTTTSAMITTILREAGMDPSFAIGGEVISLGTGAHLGTGSVMVAEADESDGSFLNYRPEIAVVTNVEADHLDHFGSLAAFEQAFDDFAARIVPGGLLIACADDPGSQALASRHASAGGRTWRYGRSEGSDVSVTAEDLPSGGSHVRLHLAPAIAGQIGQGNGHGIEAGFNLGQPGHHQALNAAAAYAAALAAGADPLLAVGGLEAFAGTRRRFELRGEREGVTVYDDYAHHPSELAAMLAGARAKVGQGRIIVVFQPHLYSRTQAFAERFAQALLAADDVFVLPVYGAREEPIEGVTSELITSLMGARGRYVTDRAEAARLAALAAGEGDMIITAGAGDVTELADVIVQELAER